MVDGVASVFFAAKRFFHCILKGIYCFWRFVELSELLVTLSKLLPSRLKTLFPLLIQLVELADGHVKTSHLSELFIISYGGFTFLISPVQAGHSRGLKDDLVALSLQFGREIRNGVQLVFVGGTLVG